MPKPLRTKFFKNLDNRGYYLFLDIDETLIHSGGLKDNPDNIITIKDEAKCDKKVFLWVNKKLFKKKNCELSRKEFSFLYHLYHN